MLRLGLSTCYFKEKTPDEWKSVREAGITDIETANAAAAKIPTLDHALTSKKEASAMLKAKTSELGLVWSRELNSFKSVGAK